MSPTDFPIAPSVNGTLQAAMVLLVGLFMALWSTFSGKGP